MRSLFNVAPFTRYDLGNHVLGVECPGGHVGLIQNGQVVCAEGSDGSLMMTSAAPKPNLNPQPRNFNGGVAYGAMGQAATPAVATPGGIPVQDILIGGVVVVGLGLLISTIL